MTSAISVKDRLKKQAMKDGIFLYALFDGEYARATMDIDLLGQRIANDADNLKKVFEEIFSIECDDALVFDLSTLQAKNITEFKEYHGVNISIIGYLDRTRVPVSIDIGFGDVIYPERVEMEFPILLDMEAPKIYAYSLYSAIAEKFEAIVSLGLANSRYKDFYDIYVLAAKYDMDGSELRNAVMETFQHRETGFEDIAAFDEDFAKDQIRESRWNAFIKKKKAMIFVSLPDTVGTIKELLVPIVSSIQNEEKFALTWDADQQLWK